MMRPESVHQSATAHGNIPAVSTASPQRCPSPILCRRPCAIIQPGNSLAALERHLFVASFRRRPSSMVLWWWWRRWTIVDSSSPPAGPTVIAWSLDLPCPPGHVTYVRSQRSQPRLCGAEADHRLHRPGTKRHTCTSSRALYSPQPEPKLVDSALSRDGLMLVRAAVAPYSMCQGNCDSESTAQPPGRNRSSPTVKHAIKRITSLSDSI